MKNLKNQIKKALNNQRGDILQLIIVIVIVVVIAVTALPGIMTGITDKGTDAVTQLDTIDTLFESDGE